MKPARYKVRQRWLLGAGSLLATGALALLGAVAELRAQAVPDLRGSWDCPRDDGLIRGEPISWTLALEIDWQEGRLFKGIYRWQVEAGLDVQEFSGGALTAGNEVRFQGVIDWDNVSLVMVDVGDTGTVAGSLANDDVLQLIGYEAGEHPLVAAAICVRLKRNQR